MEQSHNPADSHALLNVQGHRVPSNRQSVDISDTDFSHTYDSTELNTEQSRDSNSKFSDGYGGPAIKDWPTGPRNPRGFSKLLLFGDLLLILLPIAFLGEPGPYSKLYQTNADIVQGLQYPPGD